MSAGAELQNAPRRQDYLAVSVPVTTAAAKLSTLIETQLGYTPNSLAQVWREVNLQVDPETSSSLSVRVGNGNVGSTVGGVVQKGVTLVGQSQDTRATFNNVSIATTWVQAVSGSPVLNIELKAA